MRVELAAMLLVGEGEMRVVECSETGANVLLWMLLFGFFVLYRLVLDKKNPGVLQIIYGNVVILKESFAMLCAHTCDAWRCMTHITMITKIHGCRQKITSGYQSPGLHSCYALSDRISRGGMVGYSNVIFKLKLFH